MEHAAFRIGHTFWTATGAWRCTDVGTRTIVAVELGAHESPDPVDVDGPSSTSAELVFDEYDFEGCYPTAAERDAEQQDA
jgi:hypothetical protein